MKTCRYSVSAYKTSLTRGRPKWLNCHTFGFAPVSGTGANTPGTAGNGANPFSSPEVRHG